MSNVCLFVGLVSSFVSLSCIVFAMASTQWLRIRSQYLINDVGIMRHCDVVSSYCGDMKRLNDLVDAQHIALFKSVQAMYLIHALSMLFSVVMYCLHAIRFLDGKGGFKALAVFNFVSLTAGIYTIVMYALHYREFFGLTSPLYDNNRLPNSDGKGTHHVADLCVGFYMAVAGCGLAVIVVICSILEAAHAKHLLHNMQARMSTWTSPYTLFVDQDV